MNALQRPDHVVAVDTAYRSPMGGYGDRLSENERLKLLVKSHQELLSLVYGGAALELVLNHVIRTAERAFYPAACSISVFSADGKRMLLQVGPSVPPDLVATAAAHRCEGPIGPEEIAIASGEMVTVRDFAAEPGWPNLAERALANGVRSCWAVPTPHSGDQFSAVVTLYHPDPCEPDGADTISIGSLASAVGFAAKFCQREQTLRSANESFASLAATIPGVVYQRVVAPDGDIRYTYISDGALDMFGVAPEEILADPDALFSRHSPEYRATFRERLLAASRALTMWDVEASLITRDGRQKFTHAIARPQRQPDGSVLWTGIILDATRIKEAERAAADAEARTRKIIIESIAQGLLLFDADDRLIICNSHFLGLFPSLEDIAKPGAKYEDLARAELATSRGTRGIAGSHTEFQERMERHKEPRSVFEREMDDDRSILITEYRTGEGGTVVLYTDVSELKRRERKIQHLAHHDALTGLPNRVLFRQRVEQAVAQARPRGAAAAVMCLDLDHFKNVNDTLGHPAGDALLKCVADRLRSCVRDGDTVARLGGDEFGIVLANLHQPDHATKLAWRLLDALARPIDIDGQQAITGASIGIAISTTDGDDSDRLLKNADLALYRAKADGRSTFRFFEAGMDARAQARRTLEIELRVALVNEQLEVHYQPQVDVYTNEVVGCEALVRWRHPERGLIPPLEFISLAEETGMISRLGEWVLRRACKDATAWPDSIRVAVNVSPAQFKHQDLAQLVADVLQETGLSPNRLELEITESLLLRDVEANVKTLHRIKGLGVRISMDDFGTGYSSLGNLRSFPFDKIKIDRSFVQSVERSPDSAAIVRAVLSLGRSLGMATTAEGVETREQLAYLRGEGCTEVQGYYYSKPRPIGEITQMLEAGVARPTARILPAGAGSGRALGTPAAVGLSPAETVASGTRRADQSLPVG